MSSSGRRTRGGCINCKKRKRKCDEERPQCRACTNRKIRCEGYEHPVRWVDGIASRGRFVGVSNPGILLQTAPSPTTEVHENATPTYPVGQLVSTPLETSAVLARRAVTEKDSISDEERIAFEKFLAEGLHQLCNAEVYSWLAVFFKAASKESRALPLVGAALQAYYENGWTVTAIERMDHSIRTFRADLELLGSERRAATICSGLLICTMCLYQNRPITPYLHLLADMHDLKGNLAGLQPDPRVHLPSQHVLEVLGVMDMPSFLIGRLHPSLGIWRRVRGLRSEGSDQVLGKIEVVTGMPRTLLDIFAAVSTLSDENQEVEALFWSWRGCVGTFDLCLLWDSWRYAGILDCRRRLRCRVIATASRISSGSSISENKFNNEAVLCRLIASLDALVRKVETAGELEPIFLNKGLVFPYTLASLEVPLLRANPLWRSTLTGLRSTFFYKDGKAIVDETVLELLDKAWEADSELFDINQAAREQGVELGIF